MRKLRLAREVTQLTWVRPAGDRPEPGPLTHEGPPCMAPRAQAPPRPQGRKATGAGGSRVLWKSEESFLSSPLLEGNCKGIMPTGKNTCMKRACLLGDGVGDWEGVPGNVLFLTPEDGSTGFAVLSFIRFCRLKYFIILNKTKKTPNRIDFFCNTESVLRRILAKWRLLFASETLGPTIYSKTQPQDSSALKTKRKQSKPLPDHGVAAVRKATPQSLGLS